MFHALSDGGGAMVFFSTVLAEYLRQLGVEVPPGEGVLDLNEPPRREELEDAYARYAGRHALGLRRLPRAYANTGTPAPFYTFHVTMGFVPLSALRERARWYIIIRYDMVLDRYQYLLYNTKCGTAKLFRTRSVT